MSSNSAKQDPEPSAVQVSTTRSGITTITLNRPQVRNAANTPTAHKLYAALLAFDADTTQKVAILTGSNRTFCAGFDLHEVAARDASEATATRTSSVPGVESVDSQNRAPMGPSRLLLSKPLIAAVAGHAVAGGLELALLADLRVVEEDATLGVFCRRWGVPLIDGGTVRLQAVVGLGRALDMILTGRPVGAREAEAMGLATKVVGPGEALTKAAELANELLQFPQDCMKVDRRSAYYAAYEAKSVEDALRFEFEGGKKVIEKESVKGAARFSKGAGRHGRFREKL